MDGKHNKGRHNGTERKAKRISIDHQAQCRLAFDSFCVANFHCIVHQGETSHSKSAPFSASIVPLVASADTVDNETAYSDPLDGNKSLPEPEIVPAVAVVTIGLLPPLLT